MNPLLYISILYLTTSLTAAAQIAGSDSWPSFRGNNQLTGVSAAHISPPLRLLWSFKTGDAIKSSPVVANNTIFVGSNDGFLYAITSEGKLKWKFNAGTSIEAPPLVLDNIVFVGSLEGVLFAVDAVNGKLKWKYKTEGQISGSCNWT
jgi:outer membrane protein assembly factor BamB